MQQCDYCALAVFNVKCLVISNKDNGTLQIDSILSAFKVKKK